MLCNKPAFDFFNKNLRLKFFESFFEVENLNSLTEGI